MTTACIIIEHDAEPDFSWLAQDCYDPHSAEFENTYCTQADEKAGRPIDPEWYRDSANHVALQMTAFSADSDGSSNFGDIVDSLGGIDFLIDSDQYVTGTFWAVSEIPARCEYLRELAREMGLPQ